MNCLIAYYSETGNTRKIAEAIGSSILQQVNIKELDDVQSTDGFDLIFLGFPIHEFDIPSKVKSFLKEIKGQKFVCFMTHAIVVPPFRGALISRIYADFLSASDGGNPPLALFGLSLL